MSTTERKRLEHWGERAWRVSCALRWQGVSQNAFTQMPNSVFGLSRDDNVASNVRMFTWCLLDIRDKQLVCDVTTSLSQCITHTVCSLCVISGSAYKTVHISRTLNIWAAPRHRWPLLKAWVGKPRVGDANSSEPEGVSGSTTRITISQFNCKWVCTNNCNKDR